MNADIPVLTSGEKLDRLAQALEVVIPMLPEGDLLTVLSDIRGSVAFAAPESWRLWMGEAAMALGHGTTDHPEYDWQKIREAWLDALNGEAR